MHDGYNYDTTEFALNYSGCDRNISKTIQGHEALYLPDILVGFAHFLQAAGFDYVASLQAVRADGTVWRPFDLGTGASVTGDGIDTDYRGIKEAEEALYKTPEDYWDSVVDNAKDVVPTQEANKFSKFDRVIYLGNGDGDAYWGHGGKTGVPLFGAKGTVVKHHDIFGLNEYLVRFDAWSDGHNSINHDPNALASDTNYWFVKRRDISLI